MEEENRKEGRKLGSTLAQVVPRSRKRLLSFPLSLPFLVFLSFSSAGRQSAPNSWCKLVVIAKLSLSQPLLKTVLGLFVITKVESKHEME